MTDTDVMSVLQALDKEYGFSPVPDNVYHVVLDEKSKPAANVKEGQNTTFGFGWKIRCGENAGRYLWDFVGWFPKSVEKMHNEKVVGMSRGNTIQLLKAVALSMAPEDQARINEAAAHLRGAATPEEANGYLGQIASIARGIDIYVRAKTTPAKNPVTGQIDNTKDGFQNVRYLEKGNPIKATCVCVTDAVTV